MKCYRIITPATAWIQEMLVVVPWSIVVLLLPSAGSHFLGYACYFNRCDRTTEPFYPCTLSDRPFRINYGIFYAICILQNSMD